jgi:glycerate kinase
MKAEMVKLEVNGPFFTPVVATYLYAKNTKTAFIEMAEASGLKLLEAEQLDCKNATTLGTGELIQHAISIGATKIVLGIGGSATNDCGIGMATALGYRFLDDKHAEVKPIGANLSKIKHIDAAKVNAKLKTIRFKIACDVENPLYGKHGAAHVYAQQKGATTTEIELLDEGLRAFSKVIDAFFNVESQMLRGAGAAGGMGLAAKVFLNGALLPGIDLVKAMGNFDKHIKGADWIITGEGKLDKQTLSGKTIEGVLTSAKKAKVKVAAFCGTIDLNEASRAHLGLDYSDAILNYTDNIGDAMENSTHYLEKITNNFIKTIKAE